MDRWPSALQRCLQRFPVAAGRLRQVKKAGKGWGKAGCWVAKEVRYVQDGD